MISQQILGALERIADALTGIERGGLEIGTSNSGEIEERITGVENALETIAEKLESIDEHLVEVVNTVPELIKALRGK